MLNKMKSHKSLTSNITMHKTTSIPTNRGFKCSTHTHKMNTGFFPNLLLMDPITDTMNNQWLVVCNHSAETLSETEFS